MGGKGVLECTGCSRKPESSHIFCHPGTSGYIRTTARTWTAGPGACFLLGAYRGRFALNVGADGGLGPQGLQAPLELASIQVGLTDGEAGGRQPARGPACNPSQGDGMPGERGRRSGVVRVRPRVPWRASRGIPARTVRCRR